jgi:hypothetical protein
MLSLRSVESDVGALLEDFEAMVEDMESADGLAKAPGDFETTLFSLASLAGDSFQKTVIL